MVVAAPSGDYPDNAERFSLYSRAVIEASKVLGPPDVFHCHDWQSALVPILLRSLYAGDPALRHASTLFTIHNMGYQGLFAPEVLPLLNLPWDLFTIDKLEFYGKVNFLKGALSFADFITTVSRKYSQEISDESWRRMLAVHLDGTFYCTREALRLMSKKNRGAIVNLSSVAALTGLEVVPHYSAAKGAILAFTRAVARDVASRGIRVNAICPGYIDTPMTERMSPLIRTAVIARTPLRRTGEPHEVAATALFLVSDDSSFFTGQWLSPNGGLFIG